MWWFVPEAFWKYSGCICGVFWDWITFFYINGTSTLLLSFCECWPIQDMWSHFKLFRLSHSHRDCCSVTGEDSRPHTTFQTRLVESLDLELASHTDAGRGPLRSPAKGSQHWRWLTMLRKYSPTSAASYMKREHFNPSDGGGNFLQVRSCFQQTRVFYLMETAGRDLWVLNTRLSWQA